MVPSPQQPSGQLLLQLLELSPSDIAIDPTCRGGLVFRNRYCCDVVFPGANVRTPPGLRNQDVFPIGEVRFLHATNALERHHIRQRRLEDVKTVQRILSMTDPQKRACLMISLLCRRLSLAAIRDLPADLVARLVATSPLHIQDAWRRYEASLSNLASSGRLFDPARIQWQSRWAQSPVSSFGPHQTVRKSPNLNYPLHHSAEAPRPPVLEALSA